MGVYVNNPLNLKYSGSEWQQKNLPDLSMGSTRDEGSPQAEFGSPQAGWNAGARLIYAHYTGHGANTIRRMIAIWSPNHPQAANDIAARLGMSPDAPYDFSNPAKLATFMRSLEIQEQSENVYPAHMAERAAEKVIAVMTGGGDPSSAGPGEFSVKDIHEAIYEGKDPILTKKATGTEYDREVDDYLWKVYQNTPKVDSTGNFTWKDPAAAERLGMSTKDYVIGGLAREFKNDLYEEMKETERRGGKPQMTSGFRDDYRQSLITSGVRARPGGSKHGGSRVTAGYGYGEAADTDRMTAVRIGQRHPQLVQPMPGADPSHVQLRRGAKSGRRLISGEIAPDEPDPFASTIKSPSPPKFKLPDVSEEETSLLKSRGAGKISLKVNVRGPSGVKVASESKGSLAESTTVAREKKTDMPPVQAFD
jgi:hypothetical protein